MPVDVKLLEQTPAFHALQPQQRDMLAKLLHYRQFPVGKTICEQGHRGDTMYFIEKGEIVFYTHDAAGAEKVFRTLKAGDYFGEVAVFGRGIRSVNARARSEVFALELHRENVDAFVRACPEMALTMLKAMAHRMDTSAAMLHDTITPSIAKKLDESRTNIEKCVEWLVRCIGGLPFLLVNLVLCFAWVFVNKRMSKPWDSNEFGFLGLFLAFEAIVVTVLVLAKQNRDEKDANIRNDTIMSKVQSTPLEIQHLRESVKALAEQIHAERHEKPQPPK